MGCEILDREWSTQWEMEHPVRNRAPKGARSTQGGMEHSVGNKASNREWSTQWGRVSDSMGAPWIVGLHSLFSLQVIS